MLSLPFFKFLIIIFYKIYAAVSTSVQIGAVPVFTWFHIRVLLVPSAIVKPNPVNVTLANPLVVMLPTLADIAIPVTSAKVTASNVPNPRPAANLLQ
jgi:hypothetical protein